LRLEVVTGADAGEARAYDQDIEMLDGHASLLVFDDKCEYYWALKPPAGRRSARME